MKIVKRTRAVLVNGLLLACLIGLLVAYLLVVIDLPGQVYTPVQREYLERNYRRSVSQLPPTWNVVQLDGLIAPANLPVHDSRIRATLTARYEEQESVSVTVYDLDFYGHYLLTQTAPVGAAVELFFPFPGNLDTLHEVRFLVDGQQVQDALYTTQGIRWASVLEAGKEYRVEVSYKADGANSFSYGLHRNQRANIDATVTVVGLTGSEVADAFLPASARRVVGEGEVWTWNYTGLIADRDIQLTLPTRLSFAQRVAQLQDDFRVLAGLAPLLVGLFLASLTSALSLSGVRLRLEVCLLAGCGFALFYPLLTFLSGILSPVLAMICALLLVSGLVLGFLSLVLGWQRTGWRVGLLLAVFLGFFSLGMLTPWRGLLLTAGSLLLVGAFMLLYTRRPPPPEPELDVEATPLEVVPELESASPPDECAHTESAGLHCPYCARALADDYDYCPGCGHDTSYLGRCAGCGYQQFVPPELGSIHCVRCGALLDNAPVRTQNTL